MAGTSDEIYMIPNSTEVIVLANVQLEFFGYCGESVQIKPTLGFQQTISKSWPHEAGTTNPAVRTLHKARVKAYNQGAQPAHA